MLFDSMINVLWVQIFENSTSLWSEIDCLLLWKRMVSIRSVQRHHYLCLFLCWLQWQNYLCLYSDSIHGKCVETEWRAYLCNSVPFIICIKFDKYKKNLENKIWQRKLLNGIIVYVFLCAVCGWLQIVLERNRSYSLSDIYFLVFIIRLDVIIHVFLNKVFRFRHRLRFNK